MLVFMIESIVLCILFTVAILSQMKKPLSAILYSYPPKIVDRVIELGLVEDIDRKTPSWVKAIKKKWPAIILFGMIIGLFVWLVNGADTYGQRHLDMFTILIGTGMRISEFAALTIKDIDFTSNVIHVNKRIVRLVGKLTVAEPKTENAVRDIPVHGG